MFDINRRVDGAESAGESAGESGGESGGEGCVSALGTRGEAAARSSPPSPRTVTDLASPIFFSFTSEEAIFALSSVRFCISMK